MHQNPLAGVENRAQAQERYAPGALEFRGSEP
jgi:hypothetical protein